MALRALEGLKANVPGLDWQLAIQEQEAETSPDPPAAIWLLPSPEGISVGELPLAFTVPFSSSWEALDLAQAEGIRTEGHPLISAEHWLAVQPSRRPLRVRGSLPFEPDYPFLVVWSLQAEPGSETAAALLAPFLRVAVQEATPVKLAAVGDLMLDRALGEIIRRGEAPLPLHEVAPLLASADLAIGNLESALGNEGTPEKKHYTFRAPPAASQVLAQAGFDILSLANNHALDYGPAALLDGMALLKQVGIETVGAGQDEAAAYAPLIVSAGSLRLAFLAYVDVPVEGGGFDTRAWSAGLQPGVAWADPERIAAEVSAVLPMVDQVIVILHSGVEYSAQPSPRQREAAQAAIQAGAALVIGHHAHALQGVQFYRSGVIAYGLGNFAFQMNARPESIILNVWMDRSGVRMLEIVPIALDALGRPQPALGSQAEAIRREVYRLSALLNR